MRIAVFLDNVRSVHNVGSIFRTADGAGVERIYTGGVTPGPFDRFGAVRPDFAKVALGAERMVVWERAVDMLGTVDRLRREGWFILALEQSERSVPYTEASALIRRAGSDKILLILGSETEGVAVSLLEAADASIEIPMRGSKESLNVAVAFGIVVYSLINSRG